MSSTRLDLGECEYEIDPCDRPAPRPCGEAAIALWTFDDGSTMRVCPAHDMVVFRTESDLGNYP